MEKSQPPHQESDKYCPHCRQPLPPGFKLQDQPKIESTKQVNELVESANTYLEQTASIIQDFEQISKKIKIFTEAKVGQPSTQPPDQAIIRQALQEIEKQIEGQVQRLQSTTPTGVKLALVPKPKIMTKAILKNYLTSKTDTTTKFLDLVHSGLFIKIMTLGRGGFGKVVLAQDRDGFKFAVKQSPLATRAEYPDRLQQLMANLAGRLNKPLNEAQLLLTAAHPNIIAGYGLDVDTKNNLCVLMEYAPHGDYPAFCKKYKNLLAWQTKLDILFQACTALSHLHSLGIMHRDLKPENILIAGDFKVELREEKVKINSQSEAYEIKKKYFIIGKLAAKLGDMGEASDYQGQGESNDTGTGTIGFKPHEMIGGIEYTYSADIFALGVVIFFFLDDQMPWGNESDYAALNVKNPDAKVAEWLFPMMKRCLDKNPESRPQIKEIASEIACNLFLRYMRDKTAESKAKAIELAKRTDIDINHRESDVKGTMLYFAVAHEEDQECARALIERSDVDVNLPSSEGDSPLTIAAQQGCIPQAAMLLKRQDTLVNHAKPNGFTALLNAAQRGHTQIVKLLLESQDIHINLATGKGSTALIFAAQEGHIEAVKILIVDARTDLNLKTSFGSSALDWAIKEKHKDVALLLKGKGAQSFKQQWPSGWL